MIAPRASGAFVCLRCELRATRPRPSPSLVRRLPYANFTTSTFRRNNDSDHPDDAELPTSADPQEKGKLSAHPLGRVHKRKGKILQEKVARLHNQKTLGSEASIIVLRELADGTASSDPSEPSGPPEYDASPKEPSQSILASLKEAGSPLAQNEINQLLDGLRPEVSSAPGEPQYISRSEYQRLSSYLYDGFTVNQLSKYFAHCKGMGQNKGKEEVMADLSSMVTTAKRPIGRTPWYPGTTPLKARLPGSGDASTRAKRVNKSILVDQIVRKGWGAVLLEELESAGELEVTLKPWQVYLLNSTVNAAVSQHLGVHDPSPDATVLDCVARARKVKTEIMSSTVIRITAAKSNAEYAADDIEQLLQATETRKFRLSDWQEAGLLDKSRTPEKLIKLYDSESLEVIGKASGAYIQSVSNDTVCHGNTRVGFADGSSYKSEHRIKTQPRKLSVGS